MTKWWTPLSERKGHNMERLLRARNFLLAASIFSISSVAVVPSSSAFALIMSSEYPKEKRRWSACRL
jgi:hypothetical protein